MDSLDIKDKVAIVTGGANGIGNACACSLLQKKAAVKKFFYSF